MHTNRESLSKINRRSTMIILLIVVLAILLLVWGLVSWVMRGDNELERTASTISRPDKSVHGDNTVSAESGSSSDVTARNAKRKNDASLLASRAAAYISTHDQQMPTGYQNGSLIGPNGAPTGGVNLTFYKTIMITSGTQAPLQNDSLVLVTNAECTTGAATAAQSTSDFVVLYVQETSPDKFTPQCLVT